MNESYPFRVNEAIHYMNNDTRLAKPSITVSNNSLSLGNNVRSGTKDPQWRDKIAAGLDASTAYTRSGFVEVTPGRLRLRTELIDSMIPSYRYDIKTVTRAVLVGQPVLSGFTDVETRNRALASLKNQLQSRTGSSSQLANIVELRELNGLVRQAVLLSTDFCYAVLMAKKSRGKSVWRFMTKAWLGYSFAMAPLVSAIGEAGDALADYLDREDFTTRLSGSATKRAMYTYTPSCSITTIPIGASAMVRTGTVSYTLGYRFIGAFSENLSSSEDYTLLKHFGLGLESIPSTAWELTAFSWMVDYFVNVGEIIDAKFYVPPGDTKYLVENRKYKADFQHTFRYPVPFPNPNSMVCMENVPAMSTGTYTSFTRTPQSSFPQPGLVFKSLDTIGSFGIPKLLNLISLLRV